MRPTAARVAPPAKTGGAFFRLERLQARKLLRRHLAADHVTAADEDPAAKIAVQATGCVAAVMAERAAEFKLIQNLFAPEAIRPVASCNNFLPTKLRGWRRCGCRRWLGFFEDVIGHISSPMVGAAQKAQCDQRVNRNGLLTARLAPAVQLETMLQVQRRPKNFYLEKKTGSLVSRPFRAM